MSFLNKIPISIVFFLLSMGMCCAKTQKLKIITFNIKVDSKADGINQWKNRKPLMMDFLSKETPDILCMQEVLINQLSDLKMCFQMYNMVGVSRVDGKKKGDFVPIFYKKDKFDQIDSGTFCLSEKPDSIGSIGWDAKYPRIATWINLRNVNTGDIIFVLNVHLDNVGKVARVESAKLLLEKIKLLSKSGRVILTGDFNDIVSSKVHKIVSQGGFADSYLVDVKKKGVHYTFHQFGQKNLGKRYKLDYIFTSKDFKIYSVRIPKESPKRGIYLSDHNPVIVKMKY